MKKIAAFIWGMLGAFALPAGESDRWGTIETGKDADLIILEQNPQEDIRPITTVSSTLIDGRIYHKKDIMNRL